MRRSGIPLALLGSINLIPAPGIAAEGPSPTPLEKRVEELDLKVRTLERKLEVAEEAKLADKVKQTATVSAGADGFALKSTDNAFQLKLRGVLQADGRYFLEDEDRTNGDTYLLRRTRPILEGTVFKIFDFRFMPDFGNGKTVIQDAWLDARLLPWFQLKGGKFKTPFGIERLQSATAIRFVERALPNNLVPNRDIGVELHGDFGQGIVSYSAAWLNGVNDGRSSEDFGDVDNNIDKDIAGRIFAQPFLQSDLVALQGLGLGFAVSYVDARGSTTSPNLPEYRTAGQQKFFSYRTSATNPASNTFADGERLRLSPQGYYYYGPFGLLAEYVSVSQDVDRAVGATIREEDLHHDAWQVAGSYIVTGEESTYKGVKPARPFSIENGLWGAFEIKARYSELDLDEDSYTGGADSFADPTTAAEQAAAWAVGFNWYLNQNVKFAADYEHTFFDGGGGDTADSPRDREDENVVLGRVQLAF